MDRQETDRNAFFAFAILFKRGLQIRNFMLRTGPERGILYAEWDT